MSNRPEICKSKLQNTLPTLHSANECNPHVDKLRTVARTCMPSYKPRPLRLHRRGSVLPYRSRWTRAALPPQFRKAPRAPRDDAKRLIPCGVIPSVALWRSWIKSSGCHYPVPTPPKCRSPPLISASPVLWLAKTCRSLSACMSWSQQPIGILIIDQRKHACRLGSPTHLDLSVLLPATVQGQG